jgi:hypothetical protein
MGQGMVPCLNVCIAAARALSISVSGGLHGCMAHLHSSRRLPPALARPLSMNRVRFYCAAIIDSSPALAEGGAERFVNCLNCCRQV